METPREYGTIDLTDAAVGSLDLDQSIRGYTLALDGLLYTRISVAAKMSESEVHIYTPLELLGQQHSYAPQPYDQLARVLRGEGAETGARAVEIAKYDRALAAETDGLHWLMGWVLRTTVAYGFSPILAVCWIGAVLGTGTILCWIGKGCGLFIPKDSIVAEQFRLNRDLPWNYPQFNSLLFALDAFVPLIDLRQKEYWMLNPAVPGSRRVWRLTLGVGPILRAVFWLLVISGYFL